MTTNRGRMWTKVLSGLAVAGTIALSNVAMGAVLVDLRFTDGTKVRAAAPGDYLVDVWVEVTGTDSNLRDGLQWVYGSAQSVQTSGGTVLGSTGSGVTGNTATPGGAFTITPSTGQPGTAQQLGGDGIQDWGTTGTLSSTTIKYASTIFDSTLQLPGSAPVYANTTNDNANFNGTGNPVTVVSHPITNGTEYKVGTLTFHIDANGVNSAPQAGAMTSLLWVKGTGTTPAVQSSFPDETQNRAAASYTTPVVGVNSVDFTSVPEPASLALLGLGALALVARPRRKA